MRVAIGQDVGKERQNNEDQLAVHAEQGMFLLADGMGGREGGEIASAMAVSAAEQRLLEGLDDVRDEEGLARVQLAALESAHRAVQARAQQEGRLKGMGTTLLEVVLRQGKAYICSVGDSRVYLLREGLSQLTTDQTVGHHLLNDRGISRDKIAPRQWHVLTQAVGQEGPLDPELVRVALKEGDLLMLCSDGLSDMLNDEQIRQILSHRGRQVDELVADLIAAANREGGRDNISVILVLVDDPASY